MTNAISTIGFTIVLCTHNGQKLLTPTLEHLSALERPEGCALELILVDNASTDNTASFAEETWIRLGTPFPLRVLAEPRPGKGYANEMGYDAARYSYILNLDDDNWLSPDYLIMALDLLQRYTDVGILVGRNTGFFEVPPPSWFKAFKQFFIIGSPVPNPGYFPKNNFGVWGAGMVFKSADWRYLRGLGFSLLTSKVPGKASGEDYETAIALLMLGRKIYYSDQLHYKHYMPAARVDWNKLKLNFEVFGYVTNFLFLYSLVLDSHKNKYELTSELVHKKFNRYILNALASFTWKQYVAYFLKPQQEFYQLRLFQYYSEYKWFRKMKNLDKNLSILKKWMIPLLRNHPNNFTWPTPIE